MVECYIMVGTQWRKIAHLKAVEKNGGAVEGGKEKEIEIETEEKKKSSGDGVPGSPSGACPY